MGEIRLFAAGVYAGTEVAESASFAVKLLAINAVARDTLPSYSEPLLSDTALQQFSRAVSLIWSLQQETFTHTHTPFQRPLSR